LSDYIALGQTAEMKKELERTEKLDLNSSTDDLVIYMVAHFLLGEPQEVQKVMAKIAGRPDEFLATQILASTQQYAGQYRLAAATMQRAVEQAARAKAPDAQAGFLLESELARGMAGLCDSGDAVRQALALDKSKQTQAFAALTAAVCGDARVALPMASELTQKYPKDTLIQDVYGPLSKGYVALAAGRSQEAIDAAEPAKPYNANYPASYLQGLAYLQLHDAGHALGAFQAAARANAGTLNISAAPYLAQLQLGFARAYAMAGDKPNAKKSYEAFFTTWKDADTDLPQLVAAKKEYASL